MLQKLSKFHSKNNDAAILLSLSGLFRSPMVVSKRYGFVVNCSQRAESIRLRNIAKVSVSSGYHLPDADGISEIFE